MLELLAVSQMAYLQRNILIHKVVPSNNGAFLGGTHQYLDLSVSRYKPITSLLLTANVPSSLILSTLKMEATRSSEMSVLTRLARQHIPEDGILLVPFGYPTSYK
jgi:hypothetical protein